MSDVVIAAAAQEDLTTFNGAVDECSAFKDRPTCRRCSATASFQALRRELGDRAGDFVFSTDAVGEGNAQATLELSRRLAIAFTDP